MSLLEGFRLNYSLFGWPGVLLAAESRLFHSAIEVTVVVPGVKYPVHLRLRTSDLSVVRQVFVITEYEWEFSKSPKVIVDAGANTGLTSVYYVNTYPEARIIAIEPEPCNYEMLKKNVSPYSNITPVQVALWRENTELILFDPGSGDYGYQTLEEGSYDPSKTLGRVRGATLNSLMAEYHVDFIDILKVDIEGSEKEVFEDPSPWIERVGVIIVELHDNTKTGCSRSVYQATPGFEYEWRKGETTFLLKPDYKGPNAPPLGVPVRNNHVRSDQARAKLPLKIIESKVGRGYKKS